VGSSFGMNTASNSRTLTAYSTYHGLVGYVVQEVVGKDGGEQGGKEGCEVSD
jgi:hypothetical protein